MLTLLLGYAEVKRFLLVSLLLLCTFAQAQIVSALTRAGEIFPSLQEVARAAGYSSSESADGLSVRAPTGILTVFVGSPDVLWQSAQGGAGEGSASLSAPVAEGWYAPPDAFAMLGIKVTEEGVSLPDGRQLRVRVRTPTLPRQSKYSEVVSLGRGVSGLMLYAPTGTSLLLVDAGLLSLALPDERLALDGFLDEVEGYRPLYFVATSLAPTSWQAEVTFTQGGQSFSASEPSNLSVLEGDTGQLSPDAPVSGVILLPQWVSLREPLEVRWMGAAGSFQFRR